MRWIGGTGIGLICALASLPLTVSRADAWGALAVGAAPGKSTVTASVLGKFTEHEAREAALEACRTAKNASDKARLACIVVATFQGECFAFAGSEWAIGPDEQSARNEAIVKCRDAQCTRIVSGCDSRTAAR